MRGDDPVCASLFGSIDLDKQVRADYPWQVMRGIANAALKALSGEYNRLRSSLARDWISSGRLLLVS